jgi:uncharacterized membrane-anchored protein
MSRRGRIAYIVLAAAQVLFPLGLVGYNEARLAFGYDVRLKVEPVDPTDPFRGEYVDLSYEVSQVRISGDLSPGATVYVKLHKEGERWVGERAQLSRPQSHPFIRGRFVTRQGGGALVEYGIETYFVEEGRSLEYERAIARQELYVDVALDRSGRARIKRLVVVPNQ